MREITEGWEAAGPPENGWVGTALRVNSGAINKDTSGNGGLWALAPSANNTVTSPVFPSGSNREGWVRAYLYQTLTSSAVVVLRSGATDQISVVYNGATARVEIRRGNSAGTLLATSANTLTGSTWHRIEIHYFVDDSDGFVRVYANDDGTYLTPFVETSGPTDTNNGGGEVVDNVQVFSPISSSTSRYDDIAVNSISLLYDNGTGTAPVAGQTITGGTLGSTAVVQQVIGDAVSGRLILHSVSGPFQNNEPLTSLTLDALVNAPNGNYVNGLEPNSSAPGPGFIVYLTPNGNGNQTQLTGTDGDQVDNYLLVDDNPVNALTDGVVGSVNGHYDLYQMGNLPASAQSVNHVDVSAYAFKDGAVINVLNGVLRTGGLDFHSASEFDRNVAASAALYHFPFPLNPATGGQFTVSEINALEAGPRVRA